MEYIPYGIVWHPEDCVLTNLWTAVLLEQGGKWLQV